MEVVLEGNRLAVCTIPAAEGERLLEMIPEGNRLGMVSGCTTHVEGKMVPEGILEEKLGVVATANKVEVVTKLTVVGKRLEVVPEGRKLGVVSELPVDEEGKKVVTTEVGLVTEVVTEGKRLGTVPELVVIAGGIKLGVFVEGK